MRGHVRCHAAVMCAACGQGAGRCAGAQGAGRCAGAHGDAVVRGGSDLEHARARQARATRTTIAIAAASRTARTQRWWRGRWRRRWRRRRWSRGWRRARWGQARVSPRQRSRGQCSPAEARRDRADTTHAPSPRPSGGAASARPLASGGGDLRARRAHNQGSTTLPPALRRAALPSSADGRPGRNPCRRTA